MYYGRLLIRPIIVLFSYSALGCKSVLINQSIKKHQFYYTEQQIERVPMQIKHAVCGIIPRQQKQCLNYDDTVLALDAYAVGRLNT